MSGGRKLIEFLRHFRLIPSWNQWKRWSLISKLTAIGAFFGLISILISLSPLSNYTSSQRNQAIAEIKSNVEKRCIEIKEIKTFIKSYQINPDFRSRQGAIDTLEMINTYLQKTTFDVAATDRLIKEYGNLKLEKEFSRLLNQVHDDGVKLSNFMIGIIKSKGTRNKHEVELLEERFVVLINNLSHSQSAFYGFVATLTPKDFGY